MNRLKGLDYNFLALRFISAIGLAVLAVSSFAQAFGRFGYVKHVTLPGLIVDQEGFVASDSSADKIRFTEPSQIWKPVLTSETSQVVQLSGQPGCPTKASFNLLGLGFSLYFESGINLKVKCKGAPFLSWREGSVAQEVATPPVKWLVLSFRERQPPLVFGFPGDKASLVVTGKPGNWSIQSSDPFRGWVRVGLASGLEGKLATTAAGLGRLVKDVAEHDQPWTTMPPKLLKTSFAQDLYSVTATWQFDGPHAVVPPAAELAYIGGYPIEIRSKTTRMPGWNENGPIDLLNANSLTIRFPVRRIATGRSLRVGAKFADPILSGTKQDIATIANLALNSLTSERDQATRKAAEDAISDYVSKTDYYVEPWTGQQLPFAPNGSGAGMAAAEAFLMQAVTITSKATSESNSLLTSICWRQDWLTWRVWSAEESESDRADAFAALASALCPESERRLCAGMFQAGISARQGLNIWKMRESLIKTLPSFPEPLYEVRKGIFGLIGPLSPAETFVRSLGSPLRVYSDAPVLLIKNSSGYALRFFAPNSKSSIIMLASAYPIDISTGLNISSIKVEAALGFSEIHYTAMSPGVCEIQLEIPSFGKIPPLAVPVPAYSESRN